MKKLTKADLEFERGLHTRQEHKYKCKRCGHKQLIPGYMQKNLCDECNNWVFRDPKDEFKYRMSEKIIREKRK